jgi:hypothetical protein
LERSVCSIFIGGVSRKNNRDEIVGVLKRGKVLLKNSLSQSEGWWTGRGRVRVEKEAVEGKKTPSGGQWYICEGESAVCRSEEGEPWDGRDQTIVFQVAVSFLQVCAEGVSRI